MSNQALDNLVKIGKLKREPPSKTEFEGLITSAKRRLADARKTSLSAESRFDLAYNAAHSYALAALRWHGYRPEERYIVFQALVHTAGLEQPVVAPSRVHAIAPSSPIRLKNSFVRDDKGKAFLSDR